MTDELSCALCQGRGWVLRPQAEWMGVLVRVAKPFIDYLGYEAYRNQWAASLEPNTTVIGWGDTPEEALAAAVLNALEAK